MSRIRDFILTLGLLFSVQLSAGQHFDYQKLTLTENLPDELLSTRSAVFVNANRSEWKEIATTAHASFIRSGIDAVAYYHLDDIFAGLAVTRSFAADIKERGIRHIIYIEKGLRGVFNIVITPFNDTPSFFNDGQAAWYIEGANFDYLLTTLYRQAANSDQEQTNFMIIDEPEFYTDTRIITARRNQYQYLDLKMDKLAVELFPESDPDHEKKNKRLKQIFEGYPYSYGLVPHGADPGALRSEEDYEVMLRHLATAESSLMQMLDYEEVSNSTHFVHKFYIMHIYTSNFFLGQEWDGDPDWSKALRSFIPELQPGGSN